MASDGLVRHVPAVVSHAESAGRTCFNCRATSGVGDFCECCGTWLHPGCCRFCYSRVEQGEKFCGECGNNQAGAECPQCRARSFFDFCGVCFTPLTERAHLELQRALESAGAPVRAPERPTTPATAGTEADGPTEAESPPTGGHDARTAPESVVAPAPVRDTAGIENNPQAARARLMALRAMLKVTVREPTRWRCHRFGSLHTSPIDCAAPEAGGEWLFE